MEHIDIIDIFIVLARSYSPYLLGRGLLLGSSLGSLLLGLLGIGLRIFSQISMG